MTRAGTLASRIISCYGVSKFGGLRCHGYRLTPVVSLGLALAPPLTLPHGCVDWLGRWAGGWVSRGWGARARFRETLPADAALVWLESHLDWLVIEIDLFEKYYSMNFVGRVPGYNLMGLLIDLGWYLTELEGLKCWCHMETCGPRSWHRFPPLHFGAPTNLTG